MKFGKEHIKVFNTEAEYLAFKESNEYNNSNITYVRSTNVVHFNK